VTDRGSSDRGVSDRGVSGPRVVDHHATRVDPEDHFIPGDEELAELYHEDSKYTPRTLSRTLEAHRAYPSWLASRGGNAVPRKQYHDPDPVVLPPPRRLRTDLDRVLTRRRSTPPKEGPLPLRDLASILAAGFGVTSDGRRHAPSAGGLYPLEAYVVGTNVPGMDDHPRHYDPWSSTLERIPSRHDVPVASWYLMEEVGAHAASHLVVTAALPRLTIKYGPRAYRFALLEAGHATQNVLLAAAALGKAAVPVGGFYDDRVHDALGLDGVAEVALYVVALGA
jgi:SagB-type dehydrogenase family enzyme